MKVQVGEHQYAIEFQHEWVMSSRVEDSGYQMVACSPERARNLLNRPSKTQQAMKRRLREKTTCSIRDLSTPSPGDATFPVIATASVVRRHGEQQDREVGQRWALAKVLDVMYPMLLDGKYRLSAPGMREHRRAFWEVYLSRKGKQGEGLPQAQRYGSA